MLCTDILVPEGVPEQAFVQVWNKILDNYEGYLPAWNAAINGDDVLRAYRERK